MYQRTEVSFVVVYLENTIHNSINAVPTIESQVPFVKYPSHYYDWPIPIDIFVAV
jgi:hypothetical protein